MKSECVRRARSRTHFSSDRAWMKSRLTGLAGMSYCEGLEGPGSMAMLADGANDANRWEIVHIFSLSSTSEGISTVLLLSRHRKS
jgi:hypothetical protein